jgi:hypothetical protein
MRILSTLIYKIKWILSKDSIRHWACILLICVVSIIVSAKGITDESNVSLQGDMPRYMMNGVFFYDLIRDLPLDNIPEYAVRYFARYPALSLGHHPLIPSLALVPFYAIFGLSVFSARLMVVIFMLLAGVIWFKSIASIYDEKIAVLSSLLFITSPSIVHYSRIVMSEIPCLTTIIISVFSLIKFCELGKKRYLLAFLFFSSMSIYAKHIAIYMFPFYIIYFIMHKGIKRLFKKDLIIAFIFIMIIILPLIPITLKFSQFNLALVKQQINFTSSKKIPWLGFYYYYKPILQQHLTLPVLLLSLISIVTSIFQKKKENMLFIIWILLFSFLCVYIGGPPARDSIYLIPAFCIMAATIVNDFRKQLLKAFLSALIILITCYQFVLALQSDMGYAVGYEEAAKYVIDNWKGDSVLYSSAVDTGYFVFFIRKHDPNKNLVVLRADKILATSRMRRIIEDLIKSPNEIYDILNKFGISHVIMEDLKYRSPALEMLREEVRSDMFVLKKRIPIQSRYSRLKDVTLAIYEYKARTNAQTDAVLKMKIPLINQTIIVPFGDLIKKRP